jgi:hypothetical protein
MRPRSASSPHQEIADSIIGFHARQTVEKWLKAVIASHGARHEPTHDIDRLSDEPALAGSPWALV